MSASKSPVEKRIALLRDLWLEALEDPKVRVVVWRVPDNAERMLLAFLEAQRHEGDWQTPDLFIKFDAPFETGFAYSRALCDAVIGSYEASRESFEEQDIAYDWEFAKLARPDSAAGFLGLLDAFAKHHQAHFRYVAAALMPAPVTSADALKAWVQAALQAGVSATTRLVLVQSHSNPQWDWLLKEHTDVARAIDAPIDMFDIARETAAQSPSSGPAVAYRQMLTDVLALVEKGSAAQTSARADAALKIAQREQWHDQQMVLHMAVAGAHLKAQDHPAAITRYRQARVCAGQARQGDPALGGNLVMQTWFGEAGVWLVAKQFTHAAQAYCSGAKEAQQIGNRIFSLEGFRMAAFCYAHNREPEKAREHGALAAREGKEMPPDERAASTLGVALHDLLRLQDSALATKLEKLAAAYQTQIAAAHAQAEHSAAALGPAPERHALERIEADMHAQFEAAFQALREQRERLIDKGDAFFRKVVAVGRDLLHPQWSGLPEVKHPLDTEQAAWSKMPQSAELPAPGDLADVGEKLEEALT
jgi:hypothetical protein